MKIADLVSMLTVEGGAPMRLQAYDGSAFGPPDAAFTLELVNERGLRYLATAPGDLGLARAYVQGDLVLHGAHPGDPYEALKALGSWRFRRPTPTEVTVLLREMGWRNLLPPEPPSQEALPRWRRMVEGLRHSRDRDAQAIGKHYDVSNELLREGARALDGLHLRGVPQAGRQPGGGPGGEVRPGGPQAGPGAGHAAARRRLWLGRHGPARGQATTGCRWSA